jgi:hypothetical protein
MSLKTCIQRPIRTINHFYKIFCLYNLIFIKFNQICLYCTGKHLLDHHLLLLLGNYYFLIENKYLPVWPSEQLLDNDHFYRSQGWSLYSVLSVRIIRRKMQTLTTLVNPSQGSLHHTNTLVFLASMCVRDLD